MTIVHNGIIKCPKCQKFFESSVSFFVDYETKEDEEKWKNTERNKICPYCNQTLLELEWSDAIVYDPTLIKNKMTKEEILKFQPELKNGSTVFIEKPRPSIFDKIKRFFGRN
jgi:hypothetical protein